MTVKTIDELLAEVDSKREQKREREEPVRTHGGAVAGKHKTIAQALMLHQAHLVGRMTMKDIADQVGVSKEHIRKIYADQGLPHGFELTTYRAHARRWFSAVAYAARHEHKRRHGTYRRYSLGCKCTLCTKANAERSGQLRLQRGQASKHVCETCGESVWVSGNMKWRHYRRLDHPAVPVPRP